MFTRKQPEPPPQWSIETLREYLLALINANDVRYGQRYDASQSAIAAAFLAQQTATQTAFAAQKLSVDAALEAAKTAVNKAEVAAEKRFESVNEFRATLADQQRTLMPRAEVEVILQGLADKIEAITQAQLTMSGQRSGMGTAIGIASAVGGIVIGVLSHFIK
jgi:hypothetical protein